MSDSDDDGWESNEEAGSSHEIKEMENEANDETDINYSEKRQKLDSGMEQQQKSLDSSEKQQRISKQEQRDVLEQRKAHKPNFPLVIKCKALWEKIRVKQLNKQKRQELMLQLMSLVEGKCVEVIFKHDASRIIQCCLKYGNDQQRNQIARELKDSFVEVSKSQYGKFIVSKVLKFCKNYRSVVITSFYGKVRKLIRHKDASLVIEECYSQYSNAVQRTALMQEFYGPEYMIFKANEPKTLAQLLQEQPAKNKSIMGHLQQVLFSILEKGSVGIENQSIVHRAILDYFRQLALTDQSVTPLLSEAAQLAQKSTVNPAILELIEALKDHVIHILHTREGSQIVQLCILHSPPKLRKSIIKSMKTFVKKIAMEEYGFTTLLALFECVDDTVLIGKAIVSELLSDVAIDSDKSNIKSTLGDLCRDKYASKVILFLLLGRNRHLIPASVIQEFEGMDHIRLLTSKKDDAIKHKELLSYFLPEFLKGLLVEGVEGLNQLVRCKFGSVVVLETVKLCTRLGSDAGVTDAFQSLIELLSKLVEGKEALKAVSTEKAFNAGQKLRDEAHAIKQAESGIKLDEHVLVNRHATFMFKNMITNRPSSKDLEHIHSVMVTPLAKSILCNLKHWVTVCINSPSNSSGTAYVLLALCEADEQVLSQAQSIVQADNQEFMDLFKRLDVAATKESKNTSGISKLVSILLKQ